MPTYGIGIMGAFHLISKMQAMLLLFVASYLAFLTLKGHMLSCYHTQNLF